MSRDSYSRHSRDEQRLACSRQLSATGSRRLPDRVPAPHGRDTESVMAPQFTIFAKVDMTRTMDLRARLQEAGTAATYNDIFIRAVALALASIPAMNARYEHARIVPQEHIDIGIVIATKGAQTFGSVQDADALGLGEISRVTQRLGQTAWNGGVTDPAGARPASMTVSNLGMYGVSKFAGYVVPCQAAILSVGAIEQQPVCTATQGVRTRPVVELGLTCDHRVVAAADAAFFSQLLGDLLTVDIEALEAA